MAAYAALVSLMNTMEQIQNHPRLSASLYKFQVEFLSEKIGCFLDFIESYDSHGSISKEAEDLESQIASAAHAAEDVIESHIVDQIHAGSNDKSLGFLLDLQKIIVDMDSIKEKVMKVKDERGVKDRPTYSMRAASSKSLNIEKTTMVGFDAYLTQLLDVLTRQQSNRQIIPIVGMGGIGKTTLARNAYENLLLVEYFDVRDWVTVSQEYNVREILLSCLGQSSRGMDKYTEDELGEQLYKILSGRRYLIILDDIWSIETWNKIKMFFPENHNGSRIIVTTRLFDVADQFGSLKVAVNFLDDNESWKLFCHKTFGQEGCPPELEEVGKKIVEKCEGLPLSIAVIGGILGKSSRTPECWEGIAKDISSIVNSKDNNQCLNILFLSYSHLPAYLKPCFLYLGIFPSLGMSVSELTKLWVAEGFLKPKEDQSLEEIAETYIKDLVDRNLIIIHCLGKSGRLQTCFLHDLVRDLCLKINEKEKFRCVMSGLDTSQDNDEWQSIIIHESSSEKEGDEYHPRVLHTQVTTSLARSLISDKPSLVSLNSRLLGVLLLLEDDPTEHFLDTTLQQVNLRLFVHKYSSLGSFGTYKLPSSISLMWNVQTLIVNIFDEVVAPSEIWEMPQLRHLKIYWLNLPDPPPSYEHGCVGLRNLQTLKTVKNLRCSEEVTKRMPNIKKLRISFDSSSGEDKKGSYYYLHNVDRLNKLESLRYFFWRARNQENLLQNFTFPNSLKKLGLTECELHWNDLTIIDSLLYLEVLQLRWSSIKGAEWNPVEGEFCRLKFLEIGDCCDLICWNADKSHFPILEKLVLSHADKLNEIPSDIGEIPTLKSICLEECSFSAVISAIKILEEQESLGNQSPQLKVAFFHPERGQKFRELVQTEGFTNRNFELYLHN